MPCTKACKILSRGEFVTDFYSGSGTVADKRSRSAMLASAHTAYELKENIMFAVCVSRVG